jgi:3-hydroxymyristoyl/3-hydroxydecanoyl-(acyl carrier protein) dehydratase
MTGLEVVTEPEVLRTEMRDSRVFIALRVPPELVWFEGHFAGAALLPAVVQVQWVVAFGRRHFPLAASCTGMSNVKFMRLVVPGSSLQLRLGPVSSPNELPFAYFDGAAEAASGRLKFRD